MYLPESLFTDRIDVQNSSRHDLPNGQFELPAGLIKRQKQLKN